LSVGLYTGFLGSSYIARDLACVKTGGQRPALRPGRSTGRLKGSVRHIESLGNETFELEDHARQNGRLSEISRGVLMGTGIFETVNLIPSHTRLTP